MNLTLKWLLKVILPYLLQPLLDRAIRPIVQKIKARQDSKETKNH